MASSIVTTVTELPESRVRVSAEVPATEVRKSVDKAARSLGHNIRIPGFRVGKVPPQVIISRVGREAVLEEALKESLNDWYSAAIESAQISPIGNPDLDLSQLPEEGQPLQFSIEVGVLPEATLGKYKGLEVGKREPHVDEETITLQLDHLRKRMGKLEASESPVQEGDFTLIDYEGTIDGNELSTGTSRDQLVEVGTDRIAPGLDSHLIGMKAGEAKDVNLTIPAPSEEEAGNELVLNVTVKEIKKQVLPELDDDFAAEAGFDSLKDLKKDIHDRLADADREEVEREFAQAVLKVAVDNSKVKIPQPLIEARAQELWGQVIQSLSRQGITKEAYSKITGKSEEEILTEMHDEAEAGLKQEAVLKSIIVSEKIDPSEEELVERLIEAGGPTKEKPKKLLAQLKSNNRFEQFKANIAERQALKLVIDSAKPIPEKQAKAREKIWTPENKKGDDAASVEGLWTPASK